VSRKLITPPAVEPILLADAKLHLRVTESTYDAVITRLIASAREYVEQYTGRALITQTWEKYLDKFPEGIDLFNPPLQSVTSVTYVDLNGVTQNLAGTEWATDDKQEPAWVVPAYGKDWPDTLDTMNAVTVRFVCGYGAAGTDVPYQMQAACLLHIEAHYDRDERMMEKLIEAADRLIFPLRLVML
jgi:uncharacterized phiE125 gp8 family phage protein